MPRSLQPSFTDALSNKVTAPLFLCYLNIHGNRFYLTSFDDVAIFDDVAPGQKFKDANLVVRGPTQRSGGTLQAQISVPYDIKGSGGGDLTALLIAQRPQDQRAKLWQTYWHDDAYVPPILLMDAVIDDVTFGRASGGNKPRVSFTLVSRGNRGGQTPAIRLGPPMLEHLTPKGTVIVWDKGKWEVD